MAGASVLRLPRAAHRLLALRRPVFVAAGICLLAGLLRLYDLDAIRTDPYYDAAVRSMGLSWHNFFFAAYEPGGAVAIDKPPIDLWLQVLSTKLFGFNTGALLLPQALAGSAAAGGLFDLVRRPFGYLAGITAGLLAALMPISVLTSRSDTMDSLMMALTVLAMWLVMRAVELGRARFLYAGALIAGLAFEVKLLEALIVVPPLVVLYVLGSTEAPRRRAVHLAVAGVVFLAGALWWPLAVTLAGGPKPYALGSTNGTVLNAIFAYNGTGRVTSHAANRHERAQALRHSAPGPLRLFDAHRSRYMQLIGFALAAGAALAALAVALSLARPAHGAAGSRLRRAFAWAVVAWLVPAVLLFSQVQVLHTRYLEAITPPAAALVGIATGALRRRPAALAVGLGVVVLCVAWSAQRSAALVARAATDSGHVGAMPEREVARLSNYLSRRTAKLRYEVVSEGFQGVAPLVVRDARPVLIAQGTPHETLLTADRLRAEVRAGRVRYALLDDRCGTAPLRRLRPCGRAGRWIRRHAVDVSRRAGLPKGVLFSIRSGA